jgi:hypothetical protein
MPAIAGNTITQLAAAAAACSHDRFFSCPRSESVVCHLYSLEVTEVHCLLRHQQVPPAKFMHQGTDVDAAVNARADV